MDKMSDKVCMDLDQFAMELLGYDENDSLLGHPAQVIIANAQDLIKNLANDNAKLRARLDTTDQT